MLNSYKLTTLELVFSAVTTERIAILITVQSILCSMDVS